MGLRRYGTFTGGIDLPEEKHATLDSPIRSCRRPAVLRVPLGSCGRPARPLVAPGQYVSVGERIAVAESYDSVDVFAPLPGRVVGVVQTCTVTPGGFAPCPAVELADLGDPPDLREPPPVFDWRSADAGTLVQRIAEGGLTVHRRPCESLARWLQRAGRNSCHFLVANVMEDQPYVTADHRLLAEHGTAVVRGLAILAQAAEIGQVVIVVDHRRTNDYRELVGPARMYAISRIALSHKYPGGADPMLAKVLTRREMPPGADPMDLGVAVIDAATCFAAYRWVAGGVPATGRVVTASGGRAPAPGNYWAPFGTACADLVGLGESISPEDVPLICGGPMTGLRCPPTAVVSGAVNAVLALDAEAPPAPGPCIRCGWCTDHCPARLNVAALNDAFELGLIEQGSRLVAQACVECGVCSYVCPARLPLSQRVRRIKRTLTAMRQTMPLFHPR